MISNSKYFFLLVCICFCFVAKAQVGDSIKLEYIKYKADSGHVETFNFSADKKKVFIFFDAVSYRDAEMLYNGSKYIFEGDSAIIFPICFAGYLIDKRNKVFSPDMPVQLRTSIFASEFSFLNLHENDFPLMIVYDEKNKLCGMTKSVEFVTNIKCEKNIQ